MAEDLKDCPFCGRDKPVTIKRSNLAWAECQRCGACGPSSIYTDKAVTGWNKRHAEGNAVPSIIQAFAIPMILAALGAWATFLSVCGLIELYRAVNGR